MKLTHDILNLSTFKRDTAKILRRLEKTGQPIVLTVHGKGALVVQDVVSYQRLAEAQDGLEAVEGIKRGLESMHRNAGKPAEEFFEEFLSETGSSTHISKRNRSSKSGRVDSHSEETKGVLRALRRAARNALELGIKTETPVYVMRNGEIVDLTKEQPVTKKRGPRRSSSKKLSK